MSDAGFSLDSHHVRGDLFTQSGKWKYTVLLDYNDGDYDNWDTYEEARQALRRATERGISGVRVTELGDYYTLVVLEPYSKHSFPIAVRGKDVS